MHEHGINSEVDGIGFVPTTAPVSTVDFDDKLESDEVVVVAHDEQVYGEDCEED
jgi:hypothetical protein